MVRHHMPFQYFTLSVLCQILKDLPKIFKKLAIQNLPAVFGNQSTWYLHSQRLWIKLEASFMTASPLCI
jgi:hypothetical protein